LAEGILATARQAWMNAIEAFASAQDTEKTHGFPYSEARVLFEWGRMYAERNEPGDRDRSRKLLGQALDIYQRCEAKKDLKKAEAALACL